MDPHLNLKSIARETGGESQCTVHGAPQIRHLQTANLQPNLESIDHTLVDIPILLCLDFLIQRFLGVSMAKNDLQGTLDLLVLKTLDQNGVLHGYGIVLHIQSASNDVLRVEEGSLYPALHRMEQSGWISAEWAMTETNRRAKYYKLTATGRRQ